jgi:hypothetical protein
MGPAFSAARCSTGRRVTRGTAPADCFLFAEDSGAIPAGAARWLLWSAPAAKLFFLPADWLNLHELPAESPFDAKIAMSHAMVKRRDHANDLAFLLMHGEVAAYAAVGTESVSLGLAAFVPDAGLAHVIFALEHQGVNRRKPSRARERQIQWQCWRRSRDPPRQSQRCFARPRRRLPRICSTERIWSSRGRKVHDQFLPAG